MFMDECMAFFSSLLYGKTNFAWTTSNNSINKNGIVFVCHKSADSHNSSTVAFVQDFEVFVREKTSENPLATFEICEKFKNRFANADS